ncbi:MAG: hypothetical protein QMD85_02660 [Candidatus Aenigmarchaeota archaeon]|nr:hypothetical protein [Candidatus Aenigmarchaeota archaeon]
MIMLAFLFIVPFSVAQNNTVSFRLSFDINGSANDNTFVDNNSIGFYRSNNLTNYYACIEDSSFSNAFGIVHTGTDLDFINATSGSITVSENQEGNRFSMPVIGNNCSLIRTKPLSYPLQPFIQTNENAGAIELVLNYPEIDIRGDHERTGSFTILMERNLSDDKQLIFDII